MIETYPSSTTPKSFKSSTSFLNFTSISLLFSCLHSRWDSEKYVFQLSQTVQTTAHVLNLNSYRTLKGSSHWLTFNFGKLLLESRYSSLLGKKYTYIWKKKSKNKKLIFFLFFFIFKICMWGNTLFLFTFYSFSHLIYGRK